MKIQRILFKIYLGLGLTITFFLFSCSFGPETSKYGDNLRRSLAPDIIPPGAVPVYASTIVPVSGLEPISTAFNDRGNLLIVGLINRDVTPNENFLSTYDISDIDNPVFLTNLSLPPNTHTAGMIFEDGVLYIANGYGAGAGGEISAHNFSTGGLSQSLLYKFGTPGGGGHTLESFDGVFSVGIHAGVLYCVDRWRRAIKTYTLNKEGAHGITPRGIIRPDVAHGDDPTISRYTHNNGLPISVAVSDSGRMYVADSTYDAIVVYGVGRGGPDDRLHPYLSHFPDSADVFNTFDPLTMNYALSNNLGFNNPFSVSTSAGKVYVVDRDNNRVQIFRIDTSIPTENKEVYEFTIGSPIGEAKADNKSFDEPLFVSSRRRVFSVVDEGNKRVQVYKWVERVFE